MNKRQVYSKEELIEGINACSFESSTGRHERFIELYCSLDSETVRVEDGTNNYSTPVCFQICIEDRGLIVRTMRQLFITLDYIKEQLTEEHVDKDGNLVADQILVIYVHNLGFDSSFWLWDLLRQREDEGRWLSRAFITPSNIVVSFRYKRTIEFRNSQALTGLSLDASVKEFLGKDSPYRKLKSWDYSKLRSPLSKLDKDEQDYALMDVYAIVEIIREIAILHGRYDKEGRLIEPLKVADIPATRTSFVKREMREYLYKGARSEDNLRPNANARIRIMYERAKSIRFEPTEEGLHNLELVHDAYIGGLVDNNPFFSNVFVENIGSWDQTSQYPKQFLTNPFPCSQMRDVPVKGLTLEKILKMCEYKDKESKRLGLRLGAIVKVTLRGFSCKKTPVPLFAVSKDEADGMMSCGRRVLYGDEITRTLCDADLRNFVKTYNVESYVIHECKVFDMSPVPEIFARYVLRSYSEKTKYKHDEEHKVAYGLRKIATNSITGIVSEYPLYDDIELDDQGLTVKIPLTEEEKLEQLKKNDSRFEKVSMCLYIWAPYITAYAREDLYEMMIPIGRDVVCCDTDSIKFTNAEKWNKIFYEANHRNEIHLKMCGWHWFGFTERQTISLMMPCDINGEIHPIGNWENEGYDFERGKLVGIISKRAKCYMLVYEKDGERNYKYVISGVAGVNVGKYAKHVVCDKLFNIKDEIEFFLQDEIVIPSEWSGKLRVERFFRQNKFEYIDYQGNKWVMYNRTGTHLIPQEFSINSKDVDEKMVLEYLFEMKPIDVRIGNFG